MQYKKLSNYSKYLFSEDGNIYRIRKDHLQRLKLSKHPSGYTYKNLYDDSGRQKTFRVHRLIAKLFIDNPLNKPYVNHKNGEKDDNRVENLEWMTNGENVHHAYVNGLWKPVKRQKHSRFVRVTRWGTQIFYGSSRDAAKFLGCSVSSITRAYKEYNGVLRKYNCFITLCNDYPKACQKEAKGVRPESVGENPLNGSTQPLSNKGDDIV